MDLGGRGGKNAKGVTSHESYVDFEVAQQDGCAGEYIVGTLGFEKITQPITVSPSTFSPKYSPL